MSITRRNFIKTTTAASTLAFPTIIPSHVLGGPDAPSNKLNIAGIGLSGFQGRGNINACRSENIVALCDVDWKVAAASFNDHPNAKQYKDYREMLDTEKLDAVVIATPDHTHASISIAAMKKGIHVYCQKPLTHDIWESREMAKAAKKYDVVTQMGIQGHSQEGRFLIQEWIEAGAIGEVEEIDAWCSLMYSPPGHAWWSSPRTTPPKEAMQVPEHLDWDKWIGPAEMRPYHSCYHPAKWRCWWDFGCGMMGDRGAHSLDAAYSALKLGAPESIEGSDIVGGNEYVHPDKAKIVYKFPKRHGFPALKLNWYEGQEPPRPKGLEDGRRFPREGGSLFKGTKGMIWAGVYGNSPRLIPESSMKQFKPPVKTLKRARGGHYREWINAVKEGRKANADFCYSGPLTEMTLLGNLAKKFPGKELKWNDKKLKVTNHKEANDWVRRPRRKGWKI
ncbi:hypothetical protein BVX94_00495 [bacterium B17]|nr:hypothetical protein BVX94_00495 [bacterium B17]